MKRFLLTFILVCVYTSILFSQSYETQFSKPLGKVLQEIGTRFNVKLKYEVDTVGKVVPFADFRIRPYSVEESLTNVLLLFDYKMEKQDEKTYKIKGYEYPRRKPEDGKKMLAYLNTLYRDSAEWSVRRACLRREVREKLQIGPILEKRVNVKPILSSIRKYDGYSIQNFALETLPGLYVCGSIYSPLSKGKHAVILCPNGHWPDGRYNSDEQHRFATLARMGAACVSYDLFGWGESEWQVSYTAHRTSVAHIIQIMNGLTILDYMLTRPDIDASRVGANGGSGGGSQVVLLSVLDDRFAAACPTVSLASHFDGGCPCESGMPISLSCGGTNNAELMATFAPKPLCVISDGKDWTASVPELEYPFLQRIYGFYHAINSVSDVHLPAESHDFGINKRTAVYNFFIRVFGLNAAMLDESKVVFEPKEAMYSFGEKGEKMPAGAIRDFRSVEKFFDKIPDQKITSDVDVEKKAQAWTDSLKLNDPEKEVRVRTVILKQLKAVRDWNNEHPYTTVPDGINPLSGNPLTQIDREVIANSAKPKLVHEALMTGLRKELTEEQVEKMLDFYTIGKVAFTLKGYHAIVPDLTSEEENVILGYLKEAREMAVDYKSMKQISAIFEIYKTKSEQYLNSKGRNWKALYKAYVDSVKAKKEAVTLTAQTPWWKQGMTVDEFIYWTAPYPECHAATLAETPAGLVAAWFGGTKERNPDVGIWVSRQENGKWTPPVEVANGVQNDTLRYPTWNPVLYQIPNGELMLFYKVGPSPAKWWGMLVKSGDHGKTWGKPGKLPEGYIGPVKNKPVLLKNGTLMCPSSTEGDGGWRVHFEATRDFGLTWTKSGPINDGKTIGIIQPSILTYPDGSLQVLCRSRNRAIIESRSTDGGLTWSEAKATGLPNNNSGTDAVTLTDGRQLLVYNHVLPPGDLAKGERTPLNVAVSNDGLTWYAAMILEDSPVSQYSYPAVIQTSDGLVHFVYTWRRERIKHVVVDPSKLVLKKIINGQWPL